MSAHQQDLSGIGQALPNRDDDKTDGGKLKVANRSLKLAHKYYVTQNYGRAFAHFLVVLKLKPDAKEMVEAEFVASLAAWSRELICRGYIHEMFDAYEQALEVFHQCASVHTQLALHLYRLGHPHSALSRLRLSLQLDPANTIARQNQQNLVNVLIERWHFRMLNDKARNEAFKQALNYMVQRKGHKCVMDIGAGTGLLSMLSVRCGAKYVYCCEGNPSMYEICREVLVRNNMYSRVRMYGNMSTELSVPSHVPQRVSLVVTETFDAGVFGEHILETISHAWENLLEPTPRGNVMPAKVTVYATIMESEYMRMQTSLLYPTWADLTFNQESCYSYSGFYLTEKTWLMKGGYKILDEHKKLLTINLNDPQEVRKICDRGKRYRVKFHPSVEDKPGGFAIGRLDCVLIWFKLHLTSDVTIDNGLDNPESCWEHALYPIPCVSNIAAGHSIKHSDIIDVEFEVTSTVMKCKSVHVSQDDNTSESVDNVTEMLSEAVLADGACEDIASTAKDETVELESQQCSRLQHHHLDSDDFLMLNDTKYWRIFSRAIDKILRAESYKNATNQLHIISISDTLMLQPLQAALQADKLSIPHRVTFIDCNDCHASLISDICECNSLSVAAAGSGNLTFVKSREGETGSDDDWVSKIPLPSPDTDGRYLVFADIVTSTGMIYQNIIDDIALLLTKLGTGKRNAVTVMPCEVKMYGMIIESDHLLQNSAVLGNDPTLGLDIAPVFNEYRSVWYESIELSTLPHTRLSAPFEMFTLDLRPHSVEQLVEPVVKRLEVGVVSDGVAQFVLTWFDMCLVESVRISTIDVATRWRHAAAHVANYRVTSGQRLTLDVVQERGRVDVQLSLSQ